MCNECQVVTALTKEANKVQAISLTGSLVTDQNE